jgi:hypothetical protein
MGPTFPSPKSCCCKKGTSCIGQGQQAPTRRVCTSVYEDPDTLHYEFFASEAIATSSGQNDRGVFELSFRDEKLRSPSEYAGAARSRWRIEPPPRNKAFDFDSLTDVVLHLNYIAREGGPVLRDVADRAAAKRLPGDSVCFFDVRSTRRSAIPPRASEPSITEQERQKKWTIIASSLFSLPVAPSPSSLAAPTL